MLEPLIMPYAHILCVYVLIKIYIYMPIDITCVCRPYIYEARQAILSTEWGELTVATLL